MSGICGYLDWGGHLARDSIAPNALQRMLGTAAHLGPDGTATHVDCDVALGQYLDWQTPESAGQTALVAGAESRTTVVADIRLDNREDLAKQLALGPEAIGTWSDERLLLRAYEQWGIGCVERLLGDYAFAIWDAHAQRLFLARDRLGMRPLYYASYERGLVFGTEVNVVLAHGAVEAKLCRTRVADFLAVHLDDSELTFYDELLRLPPGSFVCATRESTTKRRYWELAFTPELKLRDHQEYAARFRELLVESVHCRLRARGPVGFLLSGGLDSSSIVGIARDSGLPSVREPLRTFSALFPDYPAIDESTWIADVLASGDYSPTFVRVDRCSPVARLEEEIGHHGQPFYSPNNYVDSSLLDCAKQAKVRVILDGLDGDTTVGHGWEYLGELFRRGRWRRMLRLARMLGAHTDRSTAWFLKRHAIAPTLMGVLARLEGWRGRGAKTPRLMRADLAREVNWVDRIRRAREGSAFDLLSDFRRQHWGKLTSGLIAMSFENAAQQAAVRGIVRRHPYFDQRLVEFCVSLPADQRLDRGADRIVQRRAVAGFAPESIRTRLTKSIWVENFADRMARDERSRIATWLKRDSPVAEFVDMRAAKDSCNAILNGVASERTLAEIWVVLALDVWLSRGWCRGAKSGSALE